MNRQIVGRAVEALNGSCFLDWRKETTKKLLLARGVTTAYSPETTNIAIVRDPWTRAVSSFNDQIVRGHLAANRSLGAFLHYLEHHAMREYSFHTGSVVEKCIGAPQARFDHLIDLENVGSFARVARLVPAFGALVDTGWEGCTQGDPRLYMQGSIATHANKDKDMKYRLCSPDSIKKVCDTFRADYQVYRRLGHPFRCSCETLHTYGDLKKVDGLASEKYFRRQVSSAQDVTTHQALW